MKWGSKAGLVLLVLSTPYLCADLAEIDKVEEKAKNAFIQRFQEFTQDKNVMGKPSTPKGEIVPGKKKTGFDKDGGGVLPFQSDLTYHDHVYNLVETVEDNSGRAGAAGGAGGNAAGNNQPKKKTRTLYNFISDHGAVSSSGGSSKLEREVYNLYNQYSEKNEDVEEARKRAEKEGIRNENIFQIMTREIRRDPKDKPPANEEGETARRVERMEFRPEVAEKIGKVGEEAAQTVFEAGRDAGVQQDQTELPNMTLLREAAARSTDAMWIAMQQALGQRRVNRGLRTGQMGSVQLSEDLATCEAYVAKVSALAQKETNAQRKKELLEDIDRQNKQCKQIASVPFTEINPEFKELSDDDIKKLGNNPAVQGLAATPQGQPKEAIVVGDEKNEDSIQRDLRVNLEMMAKAGKKAQSVKSNWNYTEQDNKVKMADIDENGNVIGDRYVAPLDMINDYNQKLDAAVEGYEEIKSRYPDIEVPNVKPFKINPEEDTVMGINRPTPTQMEEMGLEGTIEFKYPTNYQTLTEQK